MDRAGALRLAIDLMHFPSRVRFVRSAPLPDDVLILLRIVAGDEEAISKAVESAGRPRDTVREAAAFFIEQLLFFPGADSYRTLGVAPEATYSEIRRNMALLLKWLHPDRDRNGHQAAFAARLTRAWSDLKTMERRAAYDRSQRVSPSVKLSLRKNEKSSLHNKSGARVGLSRKAYKGRWESRHVPPSRFLRGYRYEYKGLLRRVLLLFKGLAP